MAASKLTAASCTYHVDWFYCVFLGPALCLFLVCVGTHCVNVVRSVHVRHRSENRTGQYRIPYVFVQIAILTRCVGKVYRYAGVQ